jgi:hypothetical protein
VASDTTEPRAKGEDAFYKRNPPLWRPTPNAASRRWLIAGVVFAIVVSAFMIDPRIEEHLLSSPAVPVLVTVIRAEAAIPSDETPGFFRYVVSLPDGTKGRFASERLFRPGTRLQVMHSRGRLSGRIRLGSPYRVIFEPDAGARGEEPSVPHNNALNLTKSAPLPDRVAAFAS